MVNSRNKGASYERHVAGLFKDHGYEARRGQQYCGANGDADVIGVPYIHIECKAVERLNLYDAIAQSKHDARDGETPVVIHKKNYCADLVTMEFEQWIELYKAYELYKEEWKMSDEREARLEDLNEQIKLATETLKALKKEKAIINNTDKIAGLVTQKKYSYNRYKNYIQYDCQISKDTKSWEAIKQIGLELFRPLHYPLKQKDLSHNEKVIAAKMIDEIIPIWNKYLVMVYEEDKNNE